MRGPTACAGRDRCVQPRGGRRPSVRTGRWGSCATCRDSSTTRPRRSTLGRARRRLGSARPDGPAGRMRRCRRRASSARPTCSRRCSTVSRCSPNGRGSSSCSRTCTGRTRPVSRSSTSWPATSPERAACCSSVRTARDELDPRPAQARVLAELGRHRTVSEIELTRPRQGRHRGADGRDPRSATRLGPARRGVTRAREGNPFFAEELTAAREATALPAALRNVIMMRVDRLTRPRATLRRRRRGRGRIDRSSTCSPHRRDLDADGSRRGNRGSRRPARAGGRRPIALSASGTRCRATRSTTRCLPNERARSAPQARGRVDRELRSWARSARATPRSSSPGHWWGARRVGRHAAGSTSGRPTRCRGCSRCPRPARSTSGRCRGLRPVAGRRGRIRIDHVDLLLKTADAAYLTGVPHRSVELVNRGRGDRRRHTDPRRAAVAFDDARPQPVGGRATADGGVRRVPARSPELLPGRSALGRAGRRPGRRGAELTC